MRAGAFFYILVEAGTAEFVVDCHSYNVGKGDMLLVAPRMSVELMKKSSDFGTCGLCMEPFFFDSLSIGNYVYKRLYNNSHTTYVLRLEDSDTVHIRKTLDLMSHYLTSDHPEEMAGSLVNFLLLQITEIFHSQNVHPAEESGIPMLCSAFSENYWLRITGKYMIFSSMQTPLTCLRPTCQEWYARFLEKQ